MEGIFAVKSGLADPQRKGSMGTKQVVLILTLSVFLGGCATKVKHGISTAKVGASIDGASRSVAAATVKAQKLPDKALLKNLEEANGWLVIAQKETQAVQKEADRVTNERNKFKADLDHVYWRYERIKIPCCFIVALLAFFLILRLVPWTNPYAVAAPFVGAAAAFALAFAIL
jgi:hypothetical protein